MKMIPLHDDHPFLSEISLIVIFLFVLPCSILLISAFAKCNFWYSEASVLSEIQHQNPAATAIVAAERNISDESILRVATGQFLTEYCLDTNILFKYHIKECPKN